MKPKSFKFSKKFFAAVCLSSMVLYSGSAFAADYNSGGKNWRASFSTSFMYDDNVVETPDDSANRPADLEGEEDGAFNFAGSATYRFKYDNKLDMTADYNVDSTTYFDLSTYNLTAQMFGINPVYRFTKNFNLSLRNWFVYNIVDGDSFSTVYIFHPSINYMHPKLGMTRAHYTHKHTENFQNTLRSVERNAFGIDQIVFFSNYQHYFGAGYEYAQDDSSGNAFERTMHIFTIMAKASLPFDLSLLANYKNTERIYDNQLGTTGLVLRDDDRHRFDLRLEWTGLRNLGILKKVKARLQYKHTSNDSNLLVRDFTVNQFIVGAEARF
ncbi:MAG: hypothetical protein ACQ9MH_07775 [Nitrospinales bacterium]